MIHDVANLFTYLLAIHMYSLQKCLFSFFSHLKIAFCLFAIEL